jgi:SAM-dependent methyltransferase
MPAKRFDTDTSALERRAALNDRNAALSMEEWLWSLLPKEAYGRVLDLGCGLGKQVFFLAGHQPDADITGVDVSADAVDAVNRRAAQEGRTAVRAIRLNLDTCLESLAGQTYDLIVSAYAIYYAADMLGLIKGLKDCLKPGGLAVMMGYGAGSNDEIVSLVNSCATGPEDRLDGIGDFLSASQVESLRSTYARVDSARLANHVAFSSVDDVMSWWRNHNSHRPAVDEGVKRLLTERISATGRFDLAKNVFAVVLHA